MAAAAVAAAAVAAAPAVIAHALAYMAPVIMGESPLAALPVAANPVAAAPSATAHATAAHAAVAFMGAAPTAAVHFFPISASALALPQAKLLADVLPNKRCAAKKTFITNQNIGAAKHLGSMHLCC
jgi:hypothetical protein